ncbi:MAG: hypothetical protein EPN75_12905 [Beijerinckiaceae bacterium]|nr:MAG: hypothetical protein EPN75_12905 [Beijerinckiaceae bacterium]
MTVGRKYERDVDLLLAEEFFVNPEFAESFKLLTRFAGKRALVTDFWVSKSNNLGESDLIVIYKGADERCFALLIEDKVDANLQPGQAERYRQRAERDVKGGYYSAFEIILCAPVRYIEKNYDKLAGFDRLISLDQIAGLLDAQSNRRTSYRADFLKTAGTRRISAWRREDDEATNDFWYAAYKLASQEFPILEMKPLKLTKNSAWITLRPRDLPTMPKYVYVSLKGGKGNVDLTFKETTAFQFHQLIKQFLEPDMTVTQTGAAAAIRIKSPAFRITDGLVEGLPRVKAAFEAASRLIEFYRRHRAELNACANAATPEQLSWIGTEAEDQAGPTLNSVVSS